MNPPEVVEGFGRLGKFCRGILKYAVGWHISSITLVKEPNSKSPLRATINPSPSGCHIALRVGGGAVNFVGNWFPYPSPYTGGGSPPSDQGLRVRVTPGDVDGIVPSNMTSEWLLAASATTFAWLDIEVDDGGEITSLTIEVGSALPAPPSPPDPDTNGGYPTQLFVPIWEVTTGASNVTDTWPYEFFSLSLQRSISGWDGQKFVRRLAVTRDPTSLFQ